MAALFRHVSCDDGSARTQIQNLLAGQADIQRLQTTLEAGRRTGTVFGVICRGFSPVDSLVLLAGEFVHTSLFILEGIL